MGERTFNTLFMLSSVDGKISTGDMDERDFDKDFPKINGVKEGLEQYYRLEKETDYHSLNSGKVMAKVGVNSDEFKADCPSVNFIIVDNKNLTKEGVSNLIKRTKRLYLVTSNKNHPAFSFRESLCLIYYPKKIDFNELFRRLRQEYGVERVTVQSGGTLNALLLRRGLIDRISLVIAPAVVGGGNTPTMIDGNPLRFESELKQIKALRLMKCERLENSYLHLMYDVIN